MNHNIAMIESFVVCMSLVLFEVSMRFRLELFHMYLQGYDHFCISRLIKISSDLRHHQHVN